MASLSGGGGGFLNRLKNLDAFRKVPTDLTNATYGGAVITCACAFIMLVLFVSEFNMYLTVERESEMFVDGTSFSDQKLKINFDLTFPSLPCGLLSLDVADVMGSHEMDVIRNIVKMRTDIDGREIGKMKYSPDEDDHGHGHGAVDVKFIQDQIDAKEGCHVFGKLTVNKVPGNFHISAHAAKGQFQSVKLNMTHTVNELSFGQYSMKLMPKPLKDGGAIDSISPLSGVGQTSNKDQTSFEYYIKVVPTFYKHDKRLTTVTYDTYQYTANAHEFVHPHMMPAVFFRWDLSPISVRYFNRQKSFLHFLTECCAIIGGVFTVAGIVDSFIFHGYQTIKKKINLGKQG